MNDVIGTITRYGQSQGTEHSLPSCYLPLVREMRIKSRIKQCCAGSRESDQVTTEARYLAKYLDAAANVQVLNADP